jgi:hypothetical protein
VITANPRDAQLLFEGWCLLIDVIGGRQYILRSALLEMRWRGGAWRYGSVYPLYSLSA